MIFLRVNDRDLSVYARVAKDEGMAPAPFGHRSPQFAGAGAFSEGRRHTGDDDDNAERVFPLILSADSTADLHQLIRDIESELVRGAVVEFAPDSTDARTTFDLESGRLEIDYEHWIGRAGHLRAVLRCWTRPYGTTGTARTVASLGATALAQFPVTGILGDRPAAGKLEVRVGSKVASGGRVVAYGVHRSASYLGIRGPSAAHFVAQSGATVRGASGAVGSQYLAIPVSPTGASGVALTSFLTPPGGHVGRHRVLAVGRSRLDRQLTVWARDRFGAPLGPTTAASQTDPTKWGLIDLGEVHVPARDSGRQEAVPTQYVEVIAGGASGAAVNASPAFEVNRLIFLPLDEAPGIMRTRGGQQTLLFGDSFARLAGVDSGGGSYGYRGRLSAGWHIVSDNGPEIWNRLAGNFAGDGFVAPLASGHIAFGIPFDYRAANATGFFSIASGKQRSDIVAELRTGLTFGSSGALNSSLLEFWPKAQGPSAGVMIRLQLGPSANHHIALLTDGTVRASAPLGGSTASGFALGNSHRLVGVFTGGKADVYLATGALPATPILVASRAELAVPGWPQLAMQAGSNIASAVLMADDLRVYSLAAGASDIGPREWFRFEAHPEARAIQGNASVFLANRAGDLRGNHPQVPAIGSPGPSGPAQMIVFSGDPDDFLGNDLMDVRLDAVEKFTYLR